MATSMTGYGRSVQTADGYTFTVEIKAVNHRYKEIIFRMPKELLFHEEHLKKLVSERVKRGRVEIYITMEKSASVEETVAINYNVLNAYLHAMETIRREYPAVQGSVTVADIMKLPDVFMRDQRQLAIEESVQMLEAAVEEALQELVNFRATEGEQLAKDCRIRLQSVQESLQSIEELADEVVVEYREKLAKRLEDILSETAFLDAGRLTAEVAIYADRASIAEELTRMQSHVQQFYMFLESQEPIGRKLDFLVQEMNREINTIGSKSSSIVISKYVVELKSELEKIREQVQNIE